MKSIARSALRYTSDETLGLGVDVADALEKFIDHVGAREEELQDRVKELEAEVEEKDARIAELEQELTERGAA